MSLHLGWTVVSKARTQIQYRERIKDMRTDALDYLQLNQIEFSQRFDQLACRFFQHRSSLCQLQKCLGKMVAPLASLVQESWITF